MPIETTMDRYQQLGRSAGPIDPLDITSEMKVFEFMQERVTRDIIDNRHRGYRIQTVEYTIETSGDMMWMEARMFFAPPEYL